ncbi:hypothetical protein [Bifidobacterium adolescentis]|uniref:hypothetical protein n=1 Tax=Bifidobacterium adolescentis TaxID=1680 RepID=UPI0022E908E4|nr:hypothetical protein [Bifidobacterium adolescentis]
MKYLTVSTDCTKESRDLLSVEWDEEELGKPTEEAILKALNEGRVDYDVVDVDEDDFWSFNGAEVLEVEDE